eukprot:6464824-Amphidinium_carterae.2
MIQWLKVCAPLFVHFPCRQHGRERTLPCLGGVLQHFPPINKFGDKVTRGTSQNQLAALEQDKMITAMPACGKCFVPMSFIWLATRVGKTKLAPSVTALLNMPLKSTSLPMPNQWQLLQSRTVVPKPNEHNW